MSRKHLVLTAMIFAVAMTFIDQTIVAIAVPDLQESLDLSETGVQWVVNGYMLALSALFAFGGRLADIAGHRSMVILGVLIFTVASALCGATPEGGLAEAWLIIFRVIQGAGAAIMFPAALAIVVRAFSIDERGKALAIFFGITGGLTCIGPLAGGYLTEWTWRAIFWVNVPVALIALVLIYFSKPDNNKVEAKLDWRGTVLIAGGMGLAVLGFQQSTVWGWGSPATIGAVVAGFLLIVAFVFNQLHSDNPLINVRIFANRGFSADCTVLFLLSAIFVPIFLFASMYAQISLGESAQTTGTYLLIFFAGFAIAAQVGGRMLDRGGARLPTILGCAIATAGFYLWAKAATDLSVGDQWHTIAIAGAGIGLILGPASTDAINRAPNTSYGEATGITQTVRYFAGSLSLAILGSILITKNESNVEAGLAPLGVPGDKAKQIADSLSSANGGELSGHAAGNTKIGDAIQNAFALSIQDIFYVMAGLMAVAFVFSVIAMPRGRMEEIVAMPDESKSAESPS